MNLKWTQNGFNNYIGYICSRRIDIRSRDSSWYMSCADLCSDVELLKVDSNSEAKKEALLAIAIMAKKKIACLSELITESRKAWNAD